MRSQRSKRSKRPRLDAIISPLFFFCVQSTKSIRSFAIRFRFFPRSRGCLRRRRWRRQSKLGGSVGLADVALHACFPELFRQFVNVRTKTQTHVLFCRPSISAIPTRRDNNSVEALPSLQRFFFYQAYRSPVSIISSPPPITIPVFNAQINWLIVMLFFF